MSDSSAPRCQQCGARLPAGTPEGLCPLCVLDEEPHTNGTRVLGDCELYEEIGRGGMGVVWRGRQRGLDREVAVKTLPGGDLAGAEARARFRIEAQASARLKHPNIVAIYDVGEADGMPYFVMELIAGRTLAAVIAEKPVPARTAARWLHDAALAVQHAHEHGVLHRDLKPSNILIEPDEEGGRLRVMDFGLAKLTDTESGLTLSGSAAGSPAYMPPEMVRGSASTAAGDVYGLGAVLYTTLTGRAPFQGDSVAAVLAQVEKEEPLAPRRLHAGIPRDLETICLKCLEKNPARRYGSARALAEELSRFLRGEPVLARPVAWPGKLARWAARRPALAAALALTFLAITATAVVATISAVRIDEARDRALSAAISEKRQADAARRHAVQLHVAEANRRQSDGDYIGSLPPLVAALRAEQDDPARRSEHTTRLAAALRQCPRLVHHWSLPSWHDSRDRTLTYPGRIYSADFSPDGKWIAGATREKHLHLWNVETGADHGADFAEDGAVYVKFSADGKRLLTGTARDTISLWDFEKKTALFRDVKHALDGLHPASLLPPVMDREAKRIVRVEPGEGLLAGAYVILPDSPPAGDGPLQIPLHLKAAVRSLTLSPDESRLAVGRADGTVMLHQTGTWLPIGRAFATGGAVRGMAFSPDNTRLAVLSGANFVKLYALDADAISKLEQTMRHGGASYTLAWSPDGKRVASAAYGERASFLLRADSGVADAIVRQSPGIRSAVFSPDGGTLLTAGFDNTARLFDPLTGTPNGTPLHHSGYVSAALFSPDGRRIFTGAYDSTARLWELPQPPSAPLDVANSKPSPAARFLARRSHKAGIFSNITVHSMSDGSTLGQTGPGQCAGLTDDGRVLLYREGDRFEYLELRGTEPPRTLSAFTFPYRASKVADRETEISPDGRRALVSPDRRSIHLYDLTLPEAKLITVIKLNARFTSLHFSADGSMVAVNTARPERERGSLVSLWSLAEGKAVTSFTTGQQVSRLEFSPDSRFIAWGGTVGNLMSAAARLHRCTDGAPVTPFLPHRGDVTDMEFSPDSRILATGSTDGFVRVWSTAGGTLAAPELPHPNHIANIGFSRDGRRLVTIIRGTPAMRVWDAASGEAMTPPLRLNPGSWLCRFTDDGTALITAGDTFVHWPLTDENRAPADLMEAAELLSAHRQDDVTGQRPIPAAELKAMHERRRQTAP